MICGIDGSKRHNLQNYLTLAVQGDFRLHLEKGLILGIK